VAIWTETGIPGSFGAASMSASPTAGRSRRSCSNSALTFGVIPRTKRVARVEENTAADRIELSPDQVERLNNLTPAAGERHEAGNMAVIDR
jgi:hypothetical protein